jgi:hypothetical protein
VGQPVEVADRRAVLDPAHLRLREPQPVGEHGLRDPPRAEHRRVKRVQPVGPGDVAHVAQGQCLLDLLDGPELRRHIRRRHGRLDGLRVTGITVGLVVVAGQASAARSAEAGHGARRRRGSHRDAGLVVGMRQEIAAYDPARA